MSACGTPEIDAAVAADDIDRVDSILRAHSDPGALVNATRCGTRPLLASARSVATATRLLDAGADLQSVGRWWASGLFVNPAVDPSVGRFLVDRGAPVTPHAAAAIGLVDKLAEHLNADPSCVRSAGGDGCTPLHFARNTDTAALLVGRGADVNARDDDHDSTPAQWLVDASPEVATFLLEHGATPDIFLAAALGRQDMAAELIDADRSCLSHRIGKAPWHPVGHRGRGGTILQWTVGFNCYPHQAAAAKGHHDLFHYLCAESDATTRFLVACVMANRGAAESILKSEPDMVTGLEDADRELVARYCWETNVNLEAVRLMLDCGFPIAFPERSHGYTPLHNAAWGGFADLVALLIERRHPVDLRDPTYNGTPLDWAMHCCLEDGRHPEGEYGRVVGALIDAGCPWNPSRYPTGNASIDAALRQRIASG